MDIVSFTTDDISADLTCDQTKVGKSFFVNNKEEEKENDSVMSNNTAVFDELVDTQYIRKIVPEENHVQVNINEVLMEHGIRFLDDIVVSSTRKDTLSKSKKEVDPKNVKYYKNFLSHRIKFFEDFSEFLKEELISLSNQLKEIEINFNIKNTLLEKEDKSKLRSLKTDCRNRATVSWYELRSKKELEFNDLIIQIKNDLIYEYNIKDNELEQTKSKVRELEDSIKIINDKIQNISNYDMSNVSPQSIDKLQQDILSHEQVLEDYLSEYEMLKIDVNNKKINEEAYESKHNKYKQEIEELEKQFKVCSVNENDLNEMKTKYEKISAILGIEILKYKNNEFIFNFLNYQISLNIKEDNKQMLSSVSYNGPKSIIHEYGVEILNLTPKLEFTDIIYFFNVINELYKELTLIRINNIVDIYKENDKLKILINVNDLLKFRNYIIKILISPNFDAVVEVDDKSFRYNLYKDKGFILGYMEL